MKSARRNRRPYVMLLTASITSETGNALTMLAVPWFVLETTGSAARTGLAMFMATLPMLFMAFAGVLIDRFGYRRISVLSDAASAAAVAVIPLLVLTAGLSFWLLLVLLFVRWMFASPADTARAALLPGLAERAEIPLERATAWQEVTRRGSRLAGAPLAGVLIAAFDATTVLWIDAATFLVSAVLVRYGVPAATRDLAATDDGRYLERLKAGLAYVLRDRLTRALTSMIMLTNMLNWGNSTIFLAFYAKEVVHDPRVYGLLAGVMAVGGITGSLAYGAISHRMPKRLSYALAFIIAGPPPFLALALQPSLVIIVIVLGISGLAAGVLNPIMQSVQYRRIPEELRGRVLGATSAGCFAAIPLGGLIAGVLVQTTGFAVATAAFGIVYIAACIPPFIGRTWRELDRHEARNPVLTSR